MPLTGCNNMNDWHTTCLGLKRMPRELTAFEIEAFFNFSAAERRVIEERRKPELMLRLALQVGILRMSGRLLEAVRMVPPALWRHLGEPFNVIAPDLASLRAMYRRRRTLFEHQDVACATLDFHPSTEPQRRALVRVLRDELSRTADRQRLLGFARRWLYEHRMLVPRERDLRVMIRKAVRSQESALARSIYDTVDPLPLAEWYATLTRPRDDGTTTQTWLWAAPAKHSTRQIDSLLERIDCAYRLGVDRQLTDMPDAILRRYARRLAGRPPAVGARIGEPARMIEVACFLRYCLLATTDHLLLMFRRRVAELWRRAGVEGAFTDWARLYRDLLGEMGALATDRNLPCEVLRDHLVVLIEAHRNAKLRSRAEIVRCGCCLFCRQCCEILSLNMDVVLQFPSRRVSFCLSIHGWSRFFRQISTSVKWIRLPSV